MLLILIVLASFPVEAVVNINDNKIQRDLKKELKVDTWKTEEIALNNKVNGKFYKISTSISQTVSYLYLGRVITKRSAYSVQSNDAAADFFDYYILYDASKAVRKVKIVQYQSSHGQMISSPGWLKKLEGYMANKPLEVGRQVDAISGATISVNNLIFDIKQKTLMLNELK